MKVEFSAKDKPQDFNPLDVQKTFVVCKTILENLAKSEVRYANLSHFSKAFYNEFGINTKAYMISKR